MSSNKILMADRFVELPVAAQTAYADVAVGNELGIRGTPTLVINGRFYVGARTVASLDSLLSMQH